MSENRLLKQLAASFVFLSELLDYTMLIGPEITQIEARPDL